MSPFAAVAQATARRSATGSVGPGRNDVARVVGGIA